MFLPFLLLIWSELWLLLPSLLLLLLLKQLLLRADQKQLAV